MADILFTLLTLTQLGVAISLRSEHQPLYEQELGSNGLMAATVLITVALDFVIIYWPVAQEWMSTAALSGPDMALCIAFSIAVLACTELTKLWIHRKV